VCDLELVQGGEKWQFLSAYALLSVTHHKAQCPLPQAVQDTSTTSDATIGVVAAFRQNEKHSLKQVINST
jgi:hypothetical protein